ncbi:cycloheximide-inducible CIP70 (cytochrome P450 family) [Fusarium sp. NRRL 52700]|nr:cycloheximide-inducible CIP70 (cytochrome P450 family) [Fusarium sp. NRRL 52700]
MASVLELLSRPAIAAPFVLLTSYIVYHLVLKPSNLPDLPIIGARKGDWFPILQAKIRNSLNVKAALNSAYIQYRNQAAIFPLIDGGNVIYLPRSDTKFASEQPTNMLSMHESAQQDLQTDYTTMDPSLTHDPIHLELVTTMLTKEVGNLIPDLAEEIEYCVSKQLGNNTDWSEICIMESAQKMLSGITNRAFLGLPLCRNEEMLKLAIAFAQDIPLSAMMIKFFPSFVKPLVAPLITRPNRIHSREFEKILEPEIKARLEEYDSQDEHMESGRNDYLQWLIEQAKEIGKPKNWQVSALAQRVLLLNFASIHTTTFAVTHALLDIASSSPDLILELREETESVLKQHNGKWNKRAVAQLEKLDSAIRESQRKNSIIAIGVSRTVVAEKGVTFPSGTHVPKGLRIAVPGYSVMQDSEIYPEPKTYNPLRFYDARQNEDDEYVKSARNALPTATKDFLAWGLGRNACPGRSSSGDWERQIDECESFYWLYTKEDHGCYPITACASFQLKLSSKSGHGRDIEALKNAWVFLRHKHPTLGSRIVRDDKAGMCKRIYKPFEKNEDVDTWLSSTFHIIKTYKSALEWFNDDAPVFAVPTVYIVQSKGDANDQTLFMRCPHDISDGVGMLQLLNQLFTQASQFYTRPTKYSYPLPDQDLGTRLSPCLRVAASIPDLVFEAQVQRFHEISTKNGETYNHPGLMSLPPTSSPGTEAEFKAKRIAVSVSKGMSAQILARCKTLGSGASLTHVFVSALAMALAEFQPRKQETYPVRYVDRPMLNIRPFCKEPYSSPDHAGAAYHAICAHALGIDLEVPGLGVDKDFATKTLPQIATEVRGFYNKHKPSLSGDIHEQVLFAPLTFKSQFPPPGADPWSVSDPPFCPVSLSSIGNLSSVVATSNEMFELTDVWIASQSIFTGVAIFLSSWNGEIELSSVFNSQFHSEKYVQSFLECILQYVDGFCGTKDPLTAD